MLNNILFLMAYVNCILFKCCVFNSVEYIINKVSKSSSMQVYHFDKIL